MILLFQPEWYLTLILSWIRDHREFLKTKIQPILDKNEMSHINVLVRAVFICAQANQQSALKRRVCNSELRSTGRVLEGPCRACDGEAVK